MEREGVRDKETERKRKGLLTNVKLLGKGWSTAIQRRQGHRLPSPGAQQWAHSPTHQHGQEIYTVEGK